ncbi:MAG: hypothetical protein J4N90_12495 [Chloroflexi bacterium]|nr:hypothetical protein [Chloroflexota bacterium]MCI0825562.1 hypothetical protein [Chloroflexota bacterium]
MTNTTHRCGEGQPVLYYRAVSEEAVDPPVDSGQCARAAQVQVQPAVVKLIR